MGPGDRARGRTLAGDIARLIAVTPDARRAVSGSDDGTLTVWDFVTADGIVRFRADGDVIAVACPSGTLFVAGTANGQVHVLELRK